jgi:hypothetical protein
MPVRPSSPLLDDDWEDFSGMLSILVRLYECMIDETLSIELAQEIDEMVWGDDGSDDN